MEESRSDKKKRFAALFSRSRNMKGVSQESMAIDMCVSRGTIRNWESGVSAPDAEQFLEWFRILKMNPFPWFLSYYYGEDIETITGSSGHSEKEKLKALIDTLTAEEVSALLYIITGNHGGSLNVLLNVTLAHLQSDLRARIINTKNVLNNYLLLESANELSNPDGIQPNVDMLRLAIIEATESFKEGGTGYTIKI